MGEQRGAAIPLTGQVRWYEIITPKVGKPVDCVIVGATWFGQWTHWEGTGRTGQGVTLPCTNTEHCHRCKAGMPNKWYGYVPVILNQTRLEKILCLSFGAASQLQEFTSRPNGLRGGHFLFTRCPKITKSGDRLPNGKVEVACVEWVPESKLKPEFAVESSLSRLWGINEEFLLDSGARRNEPKGGGHKASRPYLPPPDYAGGVMIPVE